MMQGVILYQGYLYMKDLKKFKKRSQKGAKKNNRKRTRNIGVVKKKS